MEELVKQLNAIVWRTSEGDLRLKAIQESRTLIDAINKEWHDMLKREKIIYDPENFKIDVNELIEITAEAYGVTKKSILSKCRQRNLVDARFSIIGYLRGAGYSFKQLGSLFQRDHTTAIHCLRSHNNLMETDDQYRNKYTQILTKLEQC